MFTGFNSTVSLLENKTLKDLQIDVNNLSAGSHKRVYVKCDKCGDVFLREFRKLDQKHHCKRHKVIDGIDHKWCNKCQKYLPYSCFNRNSARLDKLSPYCKECTLINIEENDGYRAKTNKARDNYVDWIKLNHNNRISRCRNRGIECSVDVDYLIDLWDRQNGRCAYTGIKLGWYSNSVFSAQLDRINPSLQYVEGNVVWCNKGFNNLKNSHDLNEVLNYFNQIELNRDILPVFETKILSDNAKLPTKSNKFDAGHDLYAIESTPIMPGELKNVDTGISISVPEGWYLTIEGRSSLFKSGVFPARGIIDSNFIGTLSVGLVNHSSELYIIKKGDRIAQFIPHKVRDFDVELVDKFSFGYRDRGTAGFGSSGR